MQIDLNNYTADDTDPRKYLHQPFIFDGKPTATDGHILIQLDGMDLMQTSNACEPYDDLPENFKQSLASIFEKLQSITDYREIPEYSLPDKNCELCNTTGKVDHCPECHSANGKLVFDSDWNEYEVECKTCKGGAVKEHICPRCGSTGYQRGGQPTHIGNGIHIDGPRFLPILESLPGIKVNLEGEPMQVIPFIFDSGRGGVMPMRKPSNK
jgi:hypothetical protein